MISEHQKRYLSQAIQLEETASPRITGATMILVSVLVLTFVVWSAMTNINEVARASGEVIPEGNVKTVQHLDGGIVQEMHAREGQYVEKGDVLMVLDGAGSQQDFIRAEKAGLALQLEEERLRAFLEDRDPDWESISSDPKIIKDARNFFEAENQARREEINMMRQQVVESTQRRNGYYSALKVAEGNAAIADEVYQRRMQLNARGYTSDLQLMDAKTNAHSRQGEVQAIRNNIRAANAEIDGLEIRIKSLMATQRDDASRALSTVLTEQIQNREVIDKMKNRAERLVVRAPASGIVKGLAVNTIGEVVRPSDQIMNLLPTDEKLVVSARIQPQDIGHVAVGQPVQIKFSSFDFSRYGSVTGQLDQLSATTFLADGGQRYYEGIVTLDKNHVGEDPANVVMPGMTVMADIVTGDKTIMDYLLKPIQRSVQTAFIER